MCGRYTALTEDEVIEVREILKELSFRIVRDEFDEYNKEPVEVFPTDNVPIITEGDVGIAFENGKWGFKKWDGSGVIINARSETLRFKSIFSKRLQSGRCVIPASEFFEWEKLEKGKRKYYVKDRNGNILFMAGLFRDVKDETNPKGYTREFVIITKEAIGEVAKIHDRMPVLLRIDQIESWLTGELRPEDLEKMEHDVFVNPCDERDKKRG